MLIIGPVFFLFGETGNHQVEDKKVPDSEKDLILDGGFALPHANSFGHNFRSSLIYAPKI